MNEETKYPPPELYLHQRASVVPRQRRLLGSIAEAIKSLRISLTHFVYRGGQLRRRRGSYKVTKALRREMESLGIDYFLQSSTIRSSR